jgi:hypothetical protein
MYTKSIKPVAIIRFPNDLGDRFKITAKCDKCNGTKCKVYSDTYKRYLPQILYKIPVSKVFLENVNKNVKFDIFNEINHIINGHEFE